MNFHSLCPALLLLPLLLLLPGAGRAQAPARVVQGTVREAGRPASPVPYATIDLPGTGVGTTANAEGSFRLIVPPGGQADSLVVSCVGYMPRRLLLATALASPQTVLLTPQAYGLQTVAVRGYTAQGLLSQAVRQTTRLLVSPVVVSGYYREFAQTDGQYTKFADALVDYYIQTDPRRPRRPTVQVRVRESRAGEAPPTDRTSAARAVPSPIGVREAVAWCDLMRENAFLDSLHFARYTYTIQAPAGEADAAFYLVSFAPATHESNYLDRGTVRLNRQTLAIEAIDYELDPSLAAYSPQANLLIIKAKLVSYSAHYEFRQLNGRLYPGLVRMQGGIAVTGAVGSFRLDFTSVFAATGVAAVAGSPFAKNELYRGSLYKNGTNYQHPYWLDSNIVLASEEEEAVISRLTK